jgi:DNA-binding transcriptional regulator LsrR (DeoR family)
MPAASDAHDSSAEEIELLTRVASLYYLQEATQAEIGDALGLSRPKVARLLQRARDAQIVDISVRTHPALSAGLERELVARYGLAHAVLVADQRSEQVQRRMVARAAGNVLSRLVRDGTVVAVGMGRNVAAVVDEMPDPPPRSCTFVSAIGGSLQVGTPHNSNEIARRLASRFQGAAEALYAPAYADNRRVRDAFLAHADVQTTLSRAGAADIAIVGIGDARDDSAVVQMGCFSAKEMVELRRHGAVGDVLGAFFDLEGRPVRGGSVGRRVVAVSADELARIEAVIAVVTESDKVQALRGVLASGILNVLVTTIANARGILGGAG